MTINISVHIFPYQKEYQLNTFISRGCISFWDPQGNRTNKIDIFICLIFYIMYEI